jgi:uncharacterized protein HemX
MKLLEALALLAALGVFVWWQLRDLRIAKEHTKKQREREAASAIQAQASTADGTQDRTKNHSAQQGGPQASDRAAPDTGPLR